MIRMLVAASSRKPLPHGRNEVHCSELEGRPEKPSDPPHDAVAMTLRLSSSCDTVMTFDISAKFVWLMRTVAKLALGGTGTMHTPTSPEIQSITRAKLAFVPPSCRQNEAVRLALVLTSSVARGSSRPSTGASCGSASASVHAAESFASADPTRGAASVVNSPFPLLLLLLLLLA